ncbi:MAG: nuclear transport factor 2 family protein [Acidobacteriota bacterium]|nr:nuclear transport factor 2 family protein [Acidobacteriota bacterium]MDQ7087829.1 nuclear transport factor 2 family protein [Acidobacteriota bacterium]
MNARPILTVCAALLALLFLPGCPEPGDPAADLAAVTGVLDQIATALKAADVEAIMALYEDEPAPTGYFVAGEMTGKDTIRQGWETFFAHNKVIAIEFSDVHNKLDRHLAAIYCLWTMTVESGGAQRTLSGRLTSVLGKHEGRWYIHHDHVSRPFTMPITPTESAEKAP